MLVKLAFDMQRLKKYLKKISVMIDKDGEDNFWILWGDTAVMSSRGGVPPVLPTRETPGVNRVYPYKSGSDPKLI